MIQLNKTAMPLSLLAVFFTAITAPFLVQQTAQAQTCEQLKGNTEANIGDVAQLQSGEDEQSIHLFSGADEDANMLEVGAPGERVTLRSEATAHDSCYRWFYAEVQDSGSRGWVRGVDVVRIPVAAQ